MREAEVTRMQDRIPYGTCGANRTRFASKRACVGAVLQRQDPGRFVYAPNYWQWFAHHRTHGSLPEDLRGCESQLDMIRRLGLDVFSRNIYCDQKRRWFGGLAREIYEGVHLEESERQVGSDLLLLRTWRTASGDLNERQRHLSSESTLVQERFAVSDYTSQMDAFERVVRARRWECQPALWQSWCERAGEDGCPVAGELYSPLKLLHLAMGPENTTYFLEDEPERAAAILAAHEEAQLDLVRQMADAGVPAMMAMDNLDSVFHTPDYVERYSVPFYSKASAICHERGSTFFIHACGRQRVNLRTIAACGVDGLEGLAFPPLGDVTIEEALEMTGEKFIITGGISAIETGRLHSRDDVFAYTGELLSRLRPYRHRFMLAASCNTSIDTPWQTIINFRDAWRESDK